jgi:hypothetical protein
MLLLQNNFGLILFDIFVKSSNDSLLNPSIRNICFFLLLNRILIIGTAYSWFRQMSRRIHIDQILDSCATYCPHLRRLEIQWDSETLRYSENSSKFIDHLRYLNDFIIHEFI